MSMLKISFHNYYAISYQVHSSGSFLVLHYYEADLALGANTLSILISKTKQYVIHVTDSNERVCYLVFSSQFAGENAILWSIF